MKDEIYLKVHEFGDERILAACDCEILGKKFSQGELKLEVKKNFYQGILTTLEKLEKEIKKATIVNLVGNRVINFALQRNFLDEDDILKISKIKHAQIISL